MKRTTIRWVVISIIVLGIFSVMIYYRYKKRTTKNEIDASENLQKKRMKLSSEYYGDKLNKCNTCTISSSQGLLLDNVILCNALKSLKATPYFYFEQFDTHSTMNDWIFVNLDCTMFEKFKDINSPGNILCKNIETYKILSKVLPDKNLLYTGFTSIDKFKPEIRKDYKKIIHIAGKSPNKGTQYIVDTWLDHNEWPVLTIVCNNDMGLVNIINDTINNRPQQNIKLISTFIQEDELIKYMNEYGIHICTSEFEGFGHNSNEARSVEAVTLYTDIPCFYERFKNGVNGIAVNSIQNGIVNNICPRYIPTKEGIEQAITKIINTPKEQLSMIGKQARQDFLKDDIDFKKRLVSFVKGVHTTPYIIHNMWISKDSPYENVKVPEKYNKNLETLYENNKNFKFIYWSGKDVLNLISKNFPQYLEFYKNIQPNISKCDFARFAVIAVYGGFYTDLDYYFKKNLSELLTGDSYFIYEPMDKHNTEQKHICNGIFAATKNNPFVLGWMKQMEKNNNDSNVMTKTGPVGLYKYYENNKNKILFGNSCDVLSIIDNNQISKQCSGKYNNYGVTLWYEGSGWGEPAIKENHDIIFKKIKNPIDGSEMLWEESEFTTKNWPGPYFEVDEKKAIFEFAKNNKLNYGVIDVGAHIGDLSISLALALKNIGRKDVIVYAIDPSQEKCDFIEKMALINAVSNIKILNYGLSDFQKILGHDSTSEINTGAQTWDIKKDKEKNSSSKTNEEESNIFIPADDLFKKREIEEVGIYHIDVEGHEIDVLKGSINLINTCKPILFIENYISKTNKCKNKNECYSLFKTIEDINPYYKHTGSLPNDDLIFEYI